MTNNTLQIGSLFPIGFLTVNLETELDDQCRSEINNIHNYIDIESNMVTNNNDNLMSKDWEILNSTPNLSKIIKKYIDFYSVEILGEEPKLKITASWLNCNPKGTGHYRHFHLNSRLSGIFYIRTTENTGNFKVYRPFNIQETISDTKIKYNQYNFEHIFYTPKTYDLFLFPSTLMHSVDVNQSNEQRISLAFNTFYKSTIGGVGDILHL